MNLADRLRELAERLPPGGLLTLTRDGLLALAAGGDGQASHEVLQADVTVAELATRFHRSASTVRGWCEHGRFEAAYKLNGRDWRIPKRAVDAFLAEQRGEARHGRRDHSARAARTAAGGARRGSSRAHAPWRDSTRDARGLRKRAPSCQGRVPEIHRALARGHGEMLAPRGRVFRRRPGLGLHYGRRRPPVD